MPKRLKKRRPKDVNEIAFDLVRRSTEGESAPDEAEQVPAIPPDQLSAYMAALGRKGGKVSGSRRMENLSEEKRAEIALNAARARWAKRGKKT